MVVRKLRGKAEWLICAWAAGGADRTATVTVPGLGTISPLARACGTLYRAKPGPTLTLLDPDGMHPSAGLYTITASNGPNGTITDNGAVSVVPGDKETFIITPAPGFVVDAVIVDGQPVTTDTSYTFTNVTANHTIAVSFTPSAEQCILSLQSLPTGISVQLNTQARVTPYTQQYPINTPIALIAPASVILGGQLYLFQNWLLNTVEQPDNQAVINFTLGQDTTAQATYVAATVPPTVQAQTLSTPEDTALPITLTGTDSYGLPLTFSIVTGPTHGAFKGASPLFTYTPTTNYYGTDSFTFRASNGYQQSTTATVSITIAPVNDAPIAANQASSLMKNATVAITLAATDAEKSPLTYSIVTPPAQGTLTGTGTARTYAPAVGFIGTDSFTFKAYDGQAYSNIATVSIVVKAGNTPPVALDQWVGTDKDKPAYPTMKATDVDGDPLTFIFVARPTHGAVWTRGTIGGPDFTYSPTTGYVGLDSFTFKVSDGVGESNIATVTINVHVKNTVPIAVNQAMDATAGIANPLTLTGTDVDKDQLVYIIVTPPGHGDITGTAPNLSFTPDADYLGADYLTFKVYDGQANSSIGTVNITVCLDNNTPPVANTLSVATDMNKQAYPTMKATDADGDPLTYIFCGTPDTWRGLDARHHRRSGLHLFTGNRLRRPGQLYLQGKRWVGGFECCDGDDHYSWNQCHAGCEFTSVERTSGYRHTGHAAGDGCR